MVCLSIARAASYSFNSPLSVLMLLCIRRPAVEVLSTCGREDVCRNETALVEPEVHQCEVSQQTYDVLGFFQAVVVIFNSYQV